MLDETAVAPHEPAAQDQPLVSVLMSVYNAGEYLRAAVLSILQQSHQNLELLIVDDGSTDDCMKAIDDLRDDRITRLHQDNAGKAVALNRLLDVLRGDYMAIQDADDLSHPARIQRQVEALERAPDVAAVFVGYEMMLDGRRLAPNRRAKDPAECQRMVNDMITPGFDATGMYRSSVARSFRFAPSLRIGQVYDFVLRIGEQYPLLVLGECLYTYRFLWESITKRSPHLRQACVAEVRRRARQRRGLLDPPDDGPGPKSKGKLSNRELDNNLPATFINSVLDSRSHKQWVQAVRTGFQCAALHPLDPHYYKSLAYAFLPFWFLRMLNRPRLR